MFFSSFLYEIQNPDIVLVHYLNVPYPDDNKMAVITPSLALWGDKKEWTKEELVCQLKPMCKKFVYFQFFLFFCFLFNFTQLIYGPEKKFALFPQFSAKMSLMPAMKLK